MTSEDLTRFTEKLEELMPVVMRGFARRQASELYKGKITPPQLFVMSHLERAGTSIMKELARVLDVTTAAATGVVERLVRYGYVSRIYDKSDRRLIHIKLTPRGSELLKRISRQRRQSILGIFGKISRDERSNYISILSHIRDIMTQENGIKGLNG